MSNVTRRHFAALLTAAPVLAGAGAAKWSGRIIERRVYHRAGVIPPDSALQRSGIARFHRYDRENHVEFLISFDSLAERTRVWDRFNSDPEWSALRRSQEVLLKSISFSRGTPYGHRTVTDGDFTVIVR